MPESDYTDMEKKETNKDSSNDGLVALQSDVIKHKAQDGHEAGS